MNLAKVALYLEWIAFKLRYEFAPETLNLKGDNMSKDKKWPEQGPLTDEVGKGNDPEANQPARRPSRPKRPEMYAASRIDRILGELPPAEARRVLAMVNAWYASPEPINIPPGYEE